MSLATRQSHLQLNYTFIGFFFSNLLLSLGLWVKVICKILVGQMGRKGEKERKQGGRKWEGIPAGKFSSEWSGRDSSPWERKAPGSLQVGDRGGLFSEHWERFWWWCQKRSICLLSTCQLAKGAWSRVPIPLVIRKGRKWAGSIKHSGKSHLWRTGEGTEREPPPESWYPQWGRHLYFIFAWCVTVYKTHTSSCWNLTVICRGRQNYHYFPDEEMITQK